MKGKGTKHEEGLTFGVLETTSPLFVPRSDIRVGEGNKRCIGCGPDGADNFSRRKWRRGLEN
jgi:hypothetical protein